MTRPATSKPTLTRHARQRMAERRISEHDITSALRRPSSPPRAADSGKTWVFGYATGGRILKVLLTADGSKVVTAAWPHE